MTSSNNNIKFLYMYRDGANYKNHNELIFSNPNRIPIESVLKLIRSKLIDQEFFYAKPWKIPDMHFERWDDDCDHTFHEFVGIEYSNEEPNAEVSLDVFIKIVKETQWKF